MVNQIVRWVRKPKIWRFVGFVSAVVGLLCYALSSSFNYLFGNWNLFKIILYTVFSFIICLAIFFANKWQNSPSLRLKAHLVFCVFTVTTIYSFFFDKANGKPDVYSLVSGAAFAIMSLSLSKQSHFGFEVDLLYFFCGYLTLQFMKINLFLIVAGVSFSYFLFMLRFYLHAPTEYSEELTNTVDYHAIQVDASHINFDNLVAPVLNLDALPENGDLDAQQQDSLAVVNQINSRSQQANIDDNDSNKLDYYEKLLAHTNLNQENSHVFNVFPWHTCRIRWLKDTMNSIWKILETDWCLTHEIPSVLGQIMDSNHENFKIIISTRVNVIIPRFPSLGIRQRRGSKLRNQQLKEMIDAMQNNDFIPDNYKERLLEYHKCL